MKRARIDADNAALANALQPFADLADATRDDANDDQEALVLIRHLRKARATLTLTGKGRKEGK